MLAGCPDDDSAPADAGAPDAGPIRECRAGGGWDPGTPAFVDRTDDWGLGDIHDRSIGVADIDGDGRPDLVVNAAFPQSLYERIPGRVLLNREGRFVDHTEASRLYALRGSSETGRQAAMIRFGDVNGDGHVDAFTGTFIYDVDTERDPLIDPPEIMLNDGSGSFTHAPAPVPVLPFQPLITDGFFFDQNLDGHLDLAVGFWFEQRPFESAFGQQPQLFRGDGTGVVSDVTEEVGMMLPRTDEAILDGTHRKPLFGLVMCDVDDDGRQDIVGAAYGRMFNELFLAEGDRFTEIGATTAVGADDRRDYSDDNSFRCWCAENPGVEGCAGVPAPTYACFRGWYPGQSDQPWMLGGNTFSYACGDFDGDGDLDLYESNIRHPDVGSASDPSEVLVNESTAGEVRFARPGREAMGLVPPIDLATTDEGGQQNGTFDFDNDGRLDLLLLGSPYPKNRSWLFHQRREGTLSFEWIGAEAGLDHACANGAAIADFDRDGDLDVVLGTYGCNQGDDADWVPPENQPLRFYENVSNTNNWLSVRLVGRGPGGANRDGIGARVRVTAGGVTQTRVVRTASQNTSTEAEVWFGLGAACDVERIEVRWPNAALTIEEHAGIVANHRIEIREGDDAVIYAD